ncbi:MAG: MFS transporter [Spirochaetaceae bacterium]
MRSPKAGTPFQKQSLPQELGPEERETGKRYLRRFITLNGISIAFLMNDLLILYGIRNGLSDPQLALLASFMHLTMPFLMVGKLVIPKRGLARTWGDAWFMRYLSGSVMIAAPFMAGIFPQPVVSATVLLGAFGFALFRSVGIVANSPLTGEVTTYEERGNFMSGNWTRAQTANFLSVAFVIFLIGYFDSVWVYQGVIGLGCMVGFYASRQLVKIPESSAPSESARMPISRTIRLIRIHPKFRKLLGGWAAGISSFVLVIPFSIVTIKNGYGISDYHALFFSLFILAGGIVSALINGRIADTVGPRPLLITYISVFFIAAGYWAFAPPAFYTVIAAFVFFLQGFCKTGIILSTSHYFLQAVQPEERVGISLFARMAGGAAAGLASALGGGTAFKVIRAVGIDGLDVYRTYFRLILIVLLFLLFLAHKTEKLPKEWRIRSIFTAPFTKNGRP